jgi:hypothetical protein
MATLAVLSLLSTASVAVAQGSYILDATYTGDTFFSQFDFYTVSSIISLDLLTLTYYRDLMRLTVSSSKYTATQTSPKILLIGIAMLVMIRL